jgi:nucleoside-diphosphate-sugar epimerase
MKIVVVGATGTIGAKVVESLSSRHEVVGVARGTEVKVDLGDPATIRALFERVREVDAVRR